MTILDKIIGKNREALELRKKAIPEELLIEKTTRIPPAKDFAAAISRKGRFNIIAELKKASPSKGLIREDFVPEMLCMELEKNGAAALSVLTEEFFFLGSPAYLKKVAKLAEIPVLRKDFIFDHYQVYEARALGADAVLLIAAALDEKTFNSLYQTAKNIGLHVLAEIHNREELELAARSGAKIIGVNCRNLKTFSADLGAAEELLAAIPGGRIKVAESGIRNRHDIVRLSGLGADAFLIGETLMRAASPGAELKKMLEG
jgi:indole-3-glycerol phosphate synthase